jgi:pimeloyl-ACP methyl ester carboxylesterase
MSVRALRLWFAVESRVAPASAERRAARLFATPPRQKQHTIPTHDAGDGPQIEKVEIVVRAEDRTVAVTSIGTGPTVMLVHGWGGSSADMAPLATAFARAGYRSVSFDVPGHGRSSGRESSLVEFLRAMRAVSGAVGVPELLVGHSFGGAAAVFGITELHLPVRGAVLLAPAPGPAYYLNRFVRAVGLPDARTDGMVRQLVERVGRSLESLDTVVAARDAAVPALVFHDPADREVPFEFATKITEAWRGSRLIQAPSLGHKRLLRDPATIASTIEFADSLLRRHPEGSEERQ